LYSATVAVHQSLLFFVSADGTGGGKIETPDDYGRPIGRQGGKKGEVVFKLHLLSA